MEVLYNGKINTISNDDKETIAQVLEAVRKYNNSEYFVIKVMTIDADCDDGTEARCYTWNFKAQTKYPKLFKRLYVRRIDSFMRDGAPNVHVWGCQDIDVGCKVFDASSYEGAPESPFINEALQRYEEEQRKGDCNVHENDTADTE